MKFNERLTRLREEKGWSKTYVAHALNLANMQTYANYEYGKREPDFNTVKQLADLFEVSLDYLLGKSDRKKATEFAKWLDQNMTRFNWDSTK